MTTHSPTHALPTAEGVAIAREASHPVRVPVSALRLLVDVLTEIGEGNAVSIIPIHAELTSQDAADVIAYKERIDAGHQQKIRQLRFVGTC